MSAIKTPFEIEALRKSGRIAAVVLRKVLLAVAPGDSTADLAHRAEREMEAAGARSAFKGYRGYPGSVCVSLNDEVVHGIPGDRRIGFGDIVSVDVGVIYEGFYGDNAGSVLVGGADPDRLRLLEVTRAALDSALSVCADGVRLGTVSHAIEKTANDAGCAVVRDYVGHGIGRVLHEEPQIPNYGRAGVGLRLRTGMVFCVEPMVNLGGSGIRVLEDGWTAVTQDGLPSAHFEHMVLVCDDGVEILTQGE